MANSAGGTDNNEVYHDMADLHNAAAPNSSETAPASSNSVFNAANMAKMGVFAEKPLTLTQQPAMASPKKTGAKPAAKKESCFENFRIRY